MTLSTPPARAPRRLPTARHTADERRAEIVAAAIPAFAAGGLHGTSTEAIARTVGVTQPYVFRLFGTKRALFIAVVRSAFERTRLSFDDAGRAAGGIDAGPDAVLIAMGEAYWRLLADRTLLLVQLQAYAACGDPEVREEVRVGFESIVETVRRGSGAPDDTIREWLAQGMLWNVAVAMDLTHVSAQWASLCLGTEMHPGR